MNFRLIVVCIMTSATFLNLVVSAQTPTPSSTSSEPPWAKAGTGYKVPLPKEGLVPDKETAIKIAEVVLLRLYGEEDIVSQRPYQVREEREIWWICGTQKDKELGSVFGVAISRQTAAILYLEH